MALKQYWCLWSLFFPSAYMDTGCTVICAV